MKLRKKALLAVFVLLLLSISCIYILIPGELKVNALSLANCTSTAAFRSIVETVGQKEGWPADGKGGADLRITAKSYPEMDVVVRSGKNGEDGGGEGREIPGSLTVTSYHGRDSSAILWECRFVPGLNPLSRLLQYREAVRVRRQMVLVLDSLAGYVGKGENVYGMDVMHAMAHDTALVVTTLVTPSYPSVDTLYTRIHKIRDYIAREGSKETNYPMLHIQRRPDGQYESMIAVPSDRELKAQGVLFSKHFVPWKIVVGEVKGGTYRAQRAMEELMQYTADHQLTLMAIPFQSLVTERDREPDSTKWVTRVIVPIP
ncbi:MAG TPA: GyrI-like domain-containing protein [Puia sp.]|jgi:hypothetical protein